MSLHTYREPHQATNAAEMLWRLEPLPRIELIDPLTMTPIELLSYTADLQEHMRQVRELLSVALMRIVEQVDELSSRARTIEALCAENRTLRGSAAA